MPCPENFALSTNVTPLSTPWRIWLDDTRDPRDHGWDVYTNVLWVKKAKDAMALIRLAVDYQAVNNDACIEFISFDHDLGEDLTGYDVAKVIESHCAYGELKINRDMWAVHSANPVGRRNIKSAMQSAEKCTLICELEKENGSDDV